MRIATLLLMSITLASAMPLRKGATLGYHVWRGWEKDTCFVTLAVGDSTVTDSGVLWNVSIRDSLIGGTRIRSGQAVLRVAGGDTVWQAPSCLAAWDPASQKVDSASWKAGYRKIIPYGGLAGACMAYPPDSTSWRPSALLDSANSRFEFEIAGMKRIFWWGNNYRDSITYTQKWSPKMIVSNQFTVPWVSVLHDTGWARIRDSINLEDWVLESVDGRFIESKPLAEPLVQFHQGENWAWSYNSSGYYSNPYRTFRASSDCNWTVIGVQEDSSSWLRRSIKVETKTVEVTTTYLKDSVDSVKRYTSDQVVPLRINYKLGEIVIGGDDAVSAWIAQGMIRLWSDFPHDSGRWLRVSSSMMRTLLVQWYGLDIEFLLSRKDGLLSFDYSESANPPRWSSGPNDPARFSIKLLVHDGDSSFQAVKPDAVHRRTSGSRSSLRSISHLEQELSSRPGATVRVTSVSGRSAVHSGPEALHALRSRHGIVLVELRDGDSSIRGRLLLP